jgi:hypothetical protein
MQKLRPLVLFFTIAFFTAFNSSAQKATYAGLNFTVESTSGALRPGIGAKLERKLTRRSGIESGLYYRNYVHGLVVTVVNGNRFENFPVTVSERQISIPILYKFYSRIVNISIGPTFDFYLDWKQKNKSSVVVNDYSVDPNFSIGLMGKLSKSFSLTEKIFLEPEVRYNVNFTFDRIFAGFGVAGQYKLR